MIQAPIAIQVEMLKSLGSSNSPRISCVATRADLRDMLGSFANIAGRFGAGARSDAERVRRGEEVKVVNALTTGF